MIDEQCDDFDISKDEVTESATEAAKNFDFDFDRAAFPPGKHEGNPWFVPYFFEQAVLDGCGETVDIWEVLEIFPAEREVFMLNPEYDYIGIREDSHGFVRHILLTTQQLRAMRGHH